MVLSWEIPIKKFLLHTKVRIAVIRENLQVPRQAGAVARRPFL